VEAEVVELDPKVLALMAALVRLGEVERLRMETIHRQILVLGPGAAVHQLLELVEQVEQAVLVIAT
jgi:hypothetical protein